ncbi:MAG: Gfo/Idh/MocA family oxidoreductase [Clostridia bacterium]|nr:Gfo/Idh/MocA family oxidoreductase [Clostridia bacterium]
MTKVAILGVGGISGAHIAAWKNQKDAEIIAICDIRQEMLDKHPEYKGYTDFEEMTKNEEIDILDICLPTYLHVEYSLKGIEKGYHVLCEKPVSLHPEDAHKVYEAAKAKGVNFMIAHCVRFWDEFLRLKEIYESGEYGKLISGYMFRLGCRPSWSWDGWMTDEKRSGLVPFDLHIHDLDFITYAFGAPNSHTLYRAKRDDQDYLNCVYQYDDFFLSIESSWYAGKFNFQSGFRFQFEKAVVEYKGTLKEYLTDGKVINFVPKAAEESDMEGIPTTNAYENEIIYFKKCCQDNVFPDLVKPEELKAVLDILTSF